MKDYWDIGKLRGWEKNPRSIADGDLVRLKRQIEQLGQYKPLIITADGTVLGGNMRLRAYQELGIKDIWVSIVEAPTEARKLEYALSDNDRAGSYNEGDLTDLIISIPQIKLDDFSIDLGGQISISELLGRLKSDDDWAKTFEAEGNMEAIKGFEQITFVLPKQTMADLRDKLGVYDKEKNKALSLWLYDSKTD